MKRLTASKPMEHSEILAVYAECLGKELGLNPFDQLRNIFDQSEDDISLIKKGASGARSLRYHAFTIAVQGLRFKRLKIGVSERILLESLLTRASRLAETMPLDEVTYADAKESDELKVFYKFLQWQRTCSTPEK